MQYAINHMNAEHKNDNITIVKYYGKLTSVSNAIITKIESKSLHFLVNDEIKIEIPFTNEVTEANVKDEIISLLKKARANMKEENLAKEVQDHMNSLKTVILATIDTENNPQASYSPFISFEGKNYIYLSKVAEHYVNLENNPKLEVLFLADESTSKILTARTRVKFKSVAKKLPRDIAEFEIIMDKFQESVGNTMKMIRNMGDFNLFEIEFIEGRYVKGFGQAYKITPKGKSFITEHITFDAGVPHEIK